MSRFIQAIAAGIGSAVALGLAYWGLLVLLEPWMKRIRTVLRNEHTLEAARILPALLTATAAASVALFPLSAGESLIVLCVEIAMFVLAVALVVLPGPHRHPPLRP